MVRDFRLEDRAYPEAWAYVVSRYDNSRSFIKTLFGKLTWKLFEIKQKIRFAWLSWCHSRTEGCWRKFKRYISEVSCSSCHLLTWSYPPPIIVFSILKRICGHPSLAEPGANCPNCPLICAVLQCQPSLRVFMKKAGMYFRLYFNLVDRVSQWQMTTNLSAIFAKSFVAQTRLHGTRFDSAIRFTKTGRFRSV